MEPDEHFTPAFSLNLDSRLKALKWWKHRVLNGLTLTFPMNPQRQCLYKEARPHPGPLPRGENSPKRFSLIEPLNHKRNIQHSTFKAQYRRACAAAFVQGWKLNVEC